MVLKYGKIIEDINKKLKKNSLELNNNQLIKNGAFNSQSQVIKFTS
jgi:hypothetical protein